MNLKLDEHGFQGIANIDFLNTSLVLYNFGGGSMPGRQQNKNHTGEERKTFKLSGRRGRGGKIMIFCSLKVFDPETTSLRTRNHFFFF